MSEEKVVQFLDALSGSSSDRGWSHLHPITREVMFGNSIDAYLSFVTAEPINAQWEVGRAVGDDESFYFVPVTLTAGDVPSFLTRPQMNFWLLGDALLPDAEYQLDVRFDEEGVGIWPRGG